MTRQMMWISGVVLGSFALLLVGLFLMNRPYEVSLSAEPSTKMSNEEVFPRLKGKTAEEVNAILGKPDGASWHGSLLYLDRVQSPPGRPGHTHLEVTFDDYTSPKVVTGVHFMNDSDVHKTWPNLR